MEQLSKLLQEQFNKMQNTCMLFKSSVPGDRLVELYMKGFGNDPIYLSPESSKHRCNCCFNFIRRYGGIVAINQNYEIMTIFDVQVPSEYAESLRLMKEALVAAPIENIFKETFASLQSLPYEKVRRGAKDFALGTAYNGRLYTKIEELKYKGAVKDGETRTFHHMHLRVADLFVDNSGSSIESIQARYRDDKNVFQRLMNEIPVEKMELVKELAAQGSLLNIDSHLPKIDAVLPLAKEYETVPAEKKDNWCWVKSYEFRYSRILNDAIGVLLSDVAAGQKNLQEIATAWNRMMDPTNYMKAKSVITKGMIEQAQKFVQENGYEESFTRRMATLDDINVSEILHVNNPSGIKTVSIFDTLKKDAGSGQVVIKKETLPEVSIDEFMKTILPGSTSLELYLENRLSGNFVTLTTAADGKQHTSKPIFKWPNNFSWTYNGNLAGKSLITQTVKSKGGFVDAPFRCSIIWNEEGDAPNTDLDLHCEESCGDHIYYCSHNIGKQMARFEASKSRGGGVIDIDVQRPASQTDSGVAVENIFYKDMSKVKNGTYKFYINNYNSGDNKGARAEIFIEGKTYLYEVKHKIQGSRGSDIHLATVHIENGTMKKIEHGKYKVAGEEESIDIYGLKTGQFQKVSLMCLSPNYWTEPGVGNKHYFFMLDGAKSPVPLRSFHNENLKSDLLAHRKVMDVLGDTLKVESTDGQLSGVGFNATVRDEVVLRVKGDNDKLIKIKF